MAHEPKSVDRRDVVIVGAGLAGLTLARHLLLETDCQVTLLERLRKLPQRRQKVGESSVQVAGHYYGKVLDLEELLFTQHFMKYNLRFYWKTPGRSNSNFEDYSQTYIRNYSNVPSYQIDRNVFEGSILALNQRDPRFRLVTGVSALEVDLGQSGQRHRLRYAVGAERFERSCEWFVDSTGRNRWLARRQELAQSNDIRHGASFLWVDGLVDIERLTSRSRHHRRTSAQRRQTGHLPQWLATNHFMGEGFWFWVIPLRGKTSLGLVYEHGALDPADVDSPQKLIDWVSAEFPLFAEDLARRDVLDHGRLRDFSHGCARTIHPDRWALVGEAGRFSDPLYSPGSDLIATYNTLLVDAIRAQDERELKTRCQRGEALMRSLYEAYVPSYAVSYDTLGDQECFTLKYAWELAIYFAFYVYPFINDLMIDRLGSLVMMRRFAHLGEANARIQRLLSDYMQWKKAAGLMGTAQRRLASAEARQNGGLDGEPIFQELLEFEALASAADTFLVMDGSLDMAREVLDEQGENLAGMARAIYAWVAARVLDEPRIARSAAFVAGLEDAEIVFSKQGFEQRWQAVLDASPADERELPMALDFLQRFADVERGRRAAAVTAAEQEHREGLHAAHL